MSALPESSIVGTVRPAAPWVPTLVRGVVALALGVAITFSPDHSARFGLLAFAVFALATAPAHAVAARRETPGLRSLDAVSAGLALVAGAGALVVLALGAAPFVATVSAWALLTAALESVAGVLAARRGGAARDRLTTAAVALVLAAVLVVVPPDYRQPWQVTDRGGEIEATGAVTADVMVVGILGAWAVIHGVLLVIAAISAKPPRGVSPDAATDGAGAS